MSALDEQVGSDKYSTGYPEWKIQPVEFIHLNHIPFIEGCIIKYACRHSFKNGAEDLQKARHYIDLLLEMQYDKTEEKEEPEPPRYRAWDNRVPTENIAQQEAQAGETY